MVYKIASFLSSYGDGAITGSFVENLVFLHTLHLVFAKHELIFVLVKEITTVMVLKHLMYAHLLTLCLWVLHGHR